MFDQCCWCLMLGVRRVRDVREVGQAPDPGSPPAADAHLRPEGPEQNLPQQGDTIKLTTAISISGETLLIPLLMVQKSMNRGVGGWPPAALNCQSNAMDLGIGD